MKYPCTDPDGTYHASLHVKVCIDIEGVRQDLGAEDWSVDNEAGDGREVRRCYLGSWLSMSPSGKIYMPWACSNVDACPVCGGSGDVRNPVKRRLRAKYRNKAAKLRGWLLRYHGSFIGGTWPERLTRRLKRWDELARDTLTCPRCEGLGSAEAHDDEVFNEALEAVLEHEDDLYIEQDSGDIFVVQYRDTPEEVEDE